MPRRVFKLKGADSSRIKVLCIVVDTDVNVFMVLHPVVFGELITQPVIETGRVRRDEHLLGVAPLRKPPLAVVVDVERNFLRLVNEDNGKRLARDLAEPCGVVGRLQTSDVELGLVGEENVFLFRVPRLLGVEKFLGTQFPEPRLELGVEGIPGPPRREHVNARFVLRVINQLPNRYRRLPRPDAPLQVEEPADRLDCLPLRVRPTQANHHLLVLLGHDLRAVQCVLQ